MKAQELRIGNCFMAGKNPAVVLEIMASGVSFDSINGDICASHFDWDYVSFIPLTEQWLIDFGFKRGVDFWFNGDVILDISPEGLSYRFHYSIILHVHQLQNLYFALTGEDLQL